MSSDIYLIQEHSQLAELTQKTDISEALLQKLVADEQINSALPKNWLLVSQPEIIPNAEDSSGFWTLDRLFLDQNGIPTLVKVKRDDRTPIKREIVNQMLNYPANVVNYWSLEKIRTQFETKPNAQQLLIELIGEQDANLDRFWQQVATNLQAVKIRLIFIAAQIPAELKRVVEFLNQQMKPAEFFVVEINQYLGKSILDYGS
ncbi:hypothetical protein [Calothrix sp. NIES-2098]|uniref:hypothetical protein n=1 Tax=Calothrix sp. NIES-2098 TaxID=1954171 RepID=UPI000B60B208|nr:hypothetical protein NIES2098_70630 [Calothrix sp. NIES-2098]